MIYSFGPYELDTHVYELRQSGVVRPIEPQVFDVLAYLVLHRDRLVSKEELLEKLWADRFVSETTLTSRVKEARKAVGDTGTSQSVIRTQRGRGYRFVAPVIELGAPGPPEFDLPGSDEVLPAAHEAMASVSVAMTPDTLPRERIPFVGRVREFERLGRALDRARSDTRQVVFVTGEAGAGKTTLVDAFLADTVQSLPVLVARGQCVEYRGSGEPYMPLLDAFARLASLPDNSRLIDLFRSTAPSWVVQMPSIMTEDEIGLLRARTGASGERMLRELALLVERVVAEIPLVLVLEDLHWSDYATLDAIDVLARQRASGRLMIVGTWRPSDVKAARHPIYALTQELRARGQCEVVALPLLDADDLGSYLTLRFGDSSFNARLAPILHARTGGNALFARNLVDSWIERRLIHQTDNGWTLAGELDDLERDVPDTLQHLIENQVAGLDPDQQSILETASVIGREFSVALIAASLPGADDDVERECERLVRESSIVRAAGNEQWGDGSLTSRFSFVHDLYVDVLYERIPTVRRARLHLQVGQAIERAWHGRERQRAPELALHFRRAADRQKGPRYLELAAEQALERNAHRESVEHLTAALELLEGTPETNERKMAELQVRCRLAPSLVATRGWTDSGAEENYLLSRKLAEELGEASLLSQTLYGLANMYEFAGQYRLAESITNERIALDDSGACERVLESHELLTCSLLHQGRYRESVRHGEVALASYAGLSAEDLQPDVVVLVVQACGWMSGSLHFAGRTDDALVQNTRALSLSQESGNALARASAHIQSAFVRFYRREPDKCGDLAARGGAIGREHRFPFHVACARILHGWARRTVCGFDDALREIRSGIRTCEAIGARMDLPLFHAILAEVLMQSGEPRLALEALDVGIALVNQGRTFFYAPELYRQYGLILFRLGDKHRGEAIETIERALAMSEDQECPLFSLRALVDLVTLDGDRWKPRLEEVLGGFHQGLDTVDIDAARRSLA